MHTAIGTWKHLFIFWNQVDSTHLTFTKSYQPRVPVNEKFSKISRDNQNVPGLYCDAIFWITISFSVIRIKGYCTNYKGQFHTFSIRLIFLQRNRMTTYHRVPVWLKVERCRCLYVESFLLFGRLWKGLRSNDSITLKFGNVLRLVETIMFYSQKIC